VVIVRRSRPVSPDGTATCASDALSGAKPVRRSLSVFLTTGLVDYKRLRNPFLAIGPVH